MWPKINTIKAQWELNGNAVLYRWINFLKHGERGQIEHAGLRIWSWGQNQQNMKLEAPKWR